MVQYELKRNGLYTAEKLIPGVLLIAFFVQLFLARMMGTPDRFGPLVFIGAFALSAWTDRKLMRWYLTRQSLSETSIRLSREFVDILDWD